MCIITFVIVALFYVIRIDLSCVQKPDGKGDMCERIAEHCIINIFETTCKRFVEPPIHGHICRD